MGPAWRTRREEPLLKIKKGRMQERGVQRIDGRSMYEHGLISKTGREEREEEESCVLSHRSKIAPTAGTQGLLTGTQTEPV